MNELGVRESMYYLTFFFSFIPARDGIELFYVEGNLVSI